MNFRASYSPSPHQHPCPSARLWLALSPSRSLTAIILKESPPLCPWTSKKEHRRVIPSEVIQRACWSPGSAGNREENYNLCFISGYKRPVCLMPPAPATRPLGRRIIFLCLPTGPILAKPAKSSGQPAFQDISSVQACRSHAVCLHSQPPEWSEYRITVGCQEKGKKAKSLCPFSASSNH